MRAEKTRSGHNWKIVEDDGSTVAILESRLNKRTQERFAYAFSAIDELLGIAFMAQHCLRDDAPPELRDMIKKALNKSRGKA